MYTKIQNLPIIQAPIFKEESWLTHGFGIKDISAEQYLDGLRIGNALLPKTEQPHGKKVHRLQKDYKGDLLEGDAFVTDQSGLFCFVRTADCLPILIADTKQHVVGAVHAGWKGTAAGVLLETLACFKKEYGSKSEDLKIAVGPSIGARCYEVGEEVVGALKEANLYPRPWVEAGRPGKWYLDIAYANMHLLERAGVKRDQIYLSLACTACDLEKFHSYRKEKGKLGEQVNFIMIK